MDKIDYMGEFEGNCPQNRALQVLYQMECEIGVYCSIPNRIINILIIVCNLLSRINIISTMQSQPGIDFTQISRATEATDSEHVIPFSEGEELAKHFGHRKSSQARKIKSTSKSEEEIKSQEMKVLHSFKFSVKLLNLLRDPAIDHRDFKLEYLQHLASELANLGDDSRHDEMLIYLHLILAQVDNLNELDEIGNDEVEIVRLNSEKWNHTNLMNCKCIMANLAHLKLLGSKPSGAKLSNLSCHILENDGVYLFQEGLMRLSHNLISIAMESKGHLDVYFGPFLCNKFSIQASLWFQDFQNMYSALFNYSKIFLQIAKQSSEQLKISENWYQQQVKRIVNRQFQMQDLTGALNYSYHSQQIQRLLIGLQGWKGATEQAVKYLNVFYDNCDWQINSQYNPIMAVNGDSFDINYLVDNSKKIRNCTVICLKAPCSSQYYHGEVFSWHQPKLVEYISEGESYLWIRMNFGLFPKCGFYDWTIFHLGNHGKQPINKIVDIGSKNKPELNPKQTNKSAITVKSVKGRFIVQPRSSRQLSLHQISIDCINSDKGLYKTPTFKEVMSQIKQSKQHGVNAVYLMGVFERDNDQNAQVYRKPHASPTALTNRALPSRMLGGSSQFFDLVKEAHEDGVKVIVDCSTRVSSSRMARKYESLRLRTVDQQGRLHYHYGCNGRSIGYEDTTPLNYRKKQSWDLLLQEVLSIIEHYHIDGIYLDNAFEWPQVFRINEEQMLRKDGETGESIYTQRQIFEGEVILSNKIAGYWTTSASVQYPNPFLVRLCKKIWEKYPEFCIIAEGLEIQDYDQRLISIIRSGPIPRLYKMPKAMGQVVGVHLHSSGQVSQVPAKNINTLKKWYENVVKSLPKNALLIHSTTSPVWPTLAYIFKKATWAAVDLLMLLPGLLMTSGLEQQGRVYKTKSINIHYTVADGEKRDNNSGITKMQKSFNRANSHFFQEEFGVKKRGGVVTCMSGHLKDPSQIRYLQQSFRKEVGPQFGFDLKEIYKHYHHRRQLRKKHSILCSGKLLALTAQHIYGTHNNIISFARYNEDEIFLVSINFNADAVDMHYNLTPLKHLFKNHERSNKVVKVEDLLNPNKFQEEYYLVGELVNSKIEARVEPYKTIIWRLSVLKEDKIQKALKCSSLRIKERLSRSPPAWIYSSVFFNELSYLLDNSKTQTGIANGLSKLYGTLIQPYGLNFELVISKNYELFVNKHRLEKLFGIFKLIVNHKALDSTLRQLINKMLSGNTLGPIAFVTPEIGAWSSVGGLGVMVDELSKQLVRLGEEVYIITPYYEFNKKKETNYLQRDGFTYERNITVSSAHLSYQFGIHRGKYLGVNYIWFHNPELFSKPYDGEGAFYVTKQLVFFALITLQSFCQLKIFPSIIVNNDWMCGFVSAYVKCQRYSKVFDGTKFMHICHNLDPLYEGRLYPKVQQGNLNWLVQLPAEWYVEYRNNKTVINPSRCALQTCDNWSTVSHSYKNDLLRESPLATVLWKYPHPFSFPNGIRKDERLSILRTKTPGTHLKSKKQLQIKYFKCQDLKDQIPLLAFIGRVTKQKGVHLILDSIQALLHEYNFKIQFLVGGCADSKQDYGKYCADKMRYLNYKYPNCFWSNPDMFFSDCALVNIGSDFSLMPSLFEPGGIVQHEFFCAGTPVIAFRTGGLKDTVFQFDQKTLKGNGFNFMSYELQDYKRCVKRALECYKNKPAYQKLRENAAQSVIEEEDVARGWNNQFYRMQNKIYIDWEKVDREIEKLRVQADGETQQDEDFQLFCFNKGQYWREQWDHIEQFKAVLKDASRLKGKLHSFCFETKTIPRPKQVFVCGSWDEWKTHTRLVFDKIQKNYKISFKLKPGTYLYKYIEDTEWVLTENEQKEVDLNNITNHIVTIE